MATLTYDSTPADQPEFNAEEQEALAIGEAYEAEQNQMLAGKFKDAEALEQAYIELQKKLGQSNDEPEETEGLQEGDETSEEVEEVPEAFVNATQEWYENGELSQETFDALAGMDSSDLINAYLKSQDGVSQSQQTEIGEQDISSIQQIAGGADQYQNLMAWAGENLPANYVESFDALVDSGNVPAIQLAVSGLLASYTEANGYEGRMLTGGPARDTVDAFRSQAEVVQAMSDPRYDADPAYRNDVFEKLSRSNIDY